MAVTEQLQLDFFITSASRQQTNALKAIIISLEHDGARKRQLNMKMLLPMKLLGYAVWTLTCSLCSTAP